MDDLFHNNPEDAQNTPDSKEQPAAKQESLKPDTARQTLSETYIPYTETASESDTEKPAPAAEAAPPLSNDAYTPPQQTAYTPPAAYTPPQYTVPQQPVFHQNYAPQQPYTPSQPFAAYGYNNQSTGNPVAPGYPYAPQQNPVQYPPNTEKTPPAKKPKPNKGHKVGAAIFVTFIGLCVVVACVLIATYFSRGNSLLPGTTETTGNAAVSDGDNTGNASVTISSTPTVTGSAKGVLSSSDVYDMVKNINVGVLVYSNNNLAGEGSGVIMGEDTNGKYTYIITCAHVISDSGVSIRIRFSDNTDIEAIVVGYDIKTDIGVLKVKKTGLTPAEFGDIGKVSVGQTIYAIGNPGGTEFFGSFTKGMISAMDRPVDSSVGYSQPCIQHTAAINPGNSGGALVNEYGQVIGINSSKIADTDYEGMGFSVPVDTVKKVVDEIIAHGYVTNRPKLGIKYSPVSDSQIFSIIVQSNNLPSGSIVIAEIDSDSDLTNKGVQVNDLIIKANGKDLTSTNTLPSMIDDMSVGDSLTLTIVRVNNNYSIGKPFTVKVKLIEDKGSTVNNDETTTTFNFNPFG